MEEDEGKEEKNRTVGSLNGCDESVTRNERGEGESGENGGEGEEHDVGEREGERGRWRDRLSWSGEVMKEEVRLEPNEERERKKEDSQIDPFADDTKRK